MMKQLKFLATIPAAVCMLFFVSCNSGEEKKAEETKTTDTTAVVTPAEAPPAPVEKLENIVMVQHKVADFAKWRPIFEANDSMQRAYGLTNYVLGRGMDDSNMVIIMLKMADSAKAREFAGSAALKAKMQEAGVVGKPTIDYLHVVWNEGTKIDQVARVMVKHKVKDWDAWKKEFDDHKQARIDAGLIDRGVAYTQGDNHKVSLVFAINDMAKAKAFAASKDLKDKMQKAGVDGPPSFFYYNIVQKY